VFHLNRGLIINGSAIAEIFPAKARAMWTETSLRTRDIFIQRMQEFYNGD